MTMYDLHSVLIHATTIAVSICCSVLDLWVFFPFFPAPLAEQRDYKRESCLLFYTSKTMQLHWQVGLGTEGAQCKQLTVLS